jgi:hypothetical protein
MLHAESDSLSRSLSLARALSLTHTHTRTHTHTHTTIWTEQLLLERRHLLETMKQQLKGAAGAPATAKPYENTHRDTQNTVPCSHPHTYNAKHEEDARTPLCTKNEKTQDTSTPARGGAERDRGAAASSNGGGVSCSGEGVQGVDEEALHIFERSVSSHY